MINNFKEYEKKYYHGTYEKHDFNENKFSFITPNINFAKDYGNIIYEVRLLTNDIFDPSFNEKHLDILFSTFEELYDPWDESIITKEKFSSLSDTWSILEDPDIIYWIEGNYEGVKIIEGGSEVNILVFNPKKNLKITNILTGKDHHEKT
jgi:hypothetical protein